MFDDQQFPQDNSGVHNHSSLKNSAGTQVTQDNILKFQNVVMDDQTQQLLNQPLKHPNGLDQKDAVFLNMLMDKIDRREIDLYRPSTLLNAPVYEKLDEGAQGKADLNALNLLGTIREIRKLWQNGDRDTYQIENLVHSIRLTKERLEDIGGDIFVI